MIVYVPYIAKLCKSRNHVLSWQTYKKKPPCRIIMHHAIDKVGLFKVHALKKNYP